MKNIRLTIDGKRIEAREGESLLWAALDNDIYIPNLCAVRDNREPFAACRLCFVEVEGKERPVAACTEIITDGMVVNTKGEKALRLVRSGFELLLASHHLDCAHCAKSGSCELQKIAKHIGAKLKSKRLKTLQRYLPIDDSHPEFIYDPNKCVLCGICVQTCEDIHGVGSLYLVSRGPETKIAFYGDESRCESCKECVVRCPVGVLLLKDTAEAKASNER